MSDDAAEVEAPEADDTTDEGAEEISGELSSETAVAVLEYLTKALVADPDGVRVEVVDDDGVTFNISVSDGDMGRVIGRRGRVAHAVRTIGRAASAKDGHDGVAIEFVD